MPKMRLSYEPLTKAPNLVLEVAMHGMKEIAGNFGQGVYSSINTVDDLKAWLDTNITTICQQNEKMRKAILVTAPKAYPTTPQRRFVNLIWDDQGRITLLAQITCVTQEGGES